MVALGRVTRDSTRSSSEPKWFHEGDTPEGAHDGFPNFRALSDQVAAMWGVFGGVRGQPEWDALGTRRQACLKTTAVALELAESTLGNKNYCLMKSYVPNVAVSTVKCSTTNDV